MLTASLLVIITDYFRVSNLQCEVVFNNDRNLTYSCVYTPTMEGQYRVCTARKRCHIIPQDWHCTAYQSISSLLNHKDQTCTVSKARLNHKVQNLTFRLQIHICLIYLQFCPRPFKVIIKFAAREIPKSPFTVLVEGAAGDSTKVTAKGPGLDKAGNMVGKQTFFEVFTKGINIATITAIINFELASEMVT